MEQERKPPDNRRDIDEQETDGGEPLARDLEVEERISEWLETNRIENDTPKAILYKFIDATGHSREQVDYFREIIPSRHEIGLQYGSGRYLLALSNTTCQKGRKSTCIRFNLHSCYDAKSRVFLRERAEKERETLGVTPTPPPVAIAPQSGKESLLEAFTLVRSMQADTLAIFRPLLERLLTPSAAPSAVSRSPFDDYALSRQIMKDSLKENMTMISTMQRAMLENKSQAPEDSEELPDEKQSLFEKIIALAEPFLNILAQNNMAAKMAAAGIKAAPQFKEVIKDAGLARRIISYVETKEGPERAEIALKNLGLARGDYIKAPIPAPRSPAPTTRPLPPPKNVTQAPARGNPDKGKRLNPAMEVKK